MFIKRYGRIGVGWGGGGEFGGYAGSVILVKHDFSIISPAKHNALVPRVTPERKHNTLFFEHISRPLGEHLTWSLENFKTFLKSQLQFQENKTVSLGTKIPRF